MNIRELAVYALSLVMSLSVHAALLNTAPVQKEAKEKRKTVKMSIVEPPPPPEPVEIEPPPPQPEPKPKPKPAAKPKPKVKEVKAEDLAATPPPSAAEAAAPQAAPVMPVVGLSGTSFGNGGSFSVRAGNTTMGEADGEAKRPEEVKPLPGVPTFRLDRRPRQIGDCSIDYPEELKREEITGDVILEIQVLETGNVGNVRIKESLHPRLDALATKAMKRCRFSAPLSAGEPVRAVISRYVYTWELDF